MDGNTSNNEEEDFIMALKNEMPEVFENIEDQNLSTSGEPLSQFERFLVMAARVMPSEYRVLVVVDRLPWVNTVLSEMWRGAIVRASVGRTAVWITSDRNLAQRAEKVMEFRHGGLRSSTIVQGRST